MSARAIAAPGRRGLIATATAALAAAGAATTGRAAPARAGDDAELLKLVREFHACDAQLQDWNRQEGIPDEVFEPVHDRWWEIVDAVQDMPATTLAGLAGKASLLAAIVRDCCSLDYIEPETRFAMAVVRDLASITEGGA